MFSYLQNYRFQPNVHSAKCNQVDNSIRREIYRFEMMPLKNEEQAKQVISNSLQTQKALEEPHRYNKGIFNPYTFLFVLSFLHLRGIRRAKLNLNEMDFPVQFCTTNLRNAFLISLPFSIILGSNMRNTVDTYSSHDSTRDKIMRFTERYIKFY